MRIVGLIGIGAAALASLPLVVPVVRAQVDATTDEADEGVVIRIGPDQGAGGAERREERRQRRRLAGPGFVQQAPVAVSRYWIGLGGAPLPEELRAHLNVADGEGLLVRTVAPGSPAAEAGVNRFDVILTANGAPLTSIPQLAEIVGEQGERQGVLKLELLRQGQRKSVELTPIERPVEAFADRPQRGGRLRGLMGQGGLEGLLGEGGLLGGAGSLLEEDALQGFGDLIPQLAGAGVSVSVQRQGEGPARVTVQQGGQTWEFDEGDQDAIAKLPADVRPMVERMLTQNGGALQPGFEGFGLGGPGFQFQMQGADGLAERIRAMQERMRAMQQGFGALPGDPVAPGQKIEPLIELDEAPAFNPDAAPEAEEIEAGPIEIEIPSDSKE